MVTTDWHVLSLLRLAAALLYSGVFWGLVLFLVDACALDRRVPFLGVGLATGAIVLMVYLFVGVVTTPDAFVMAGQPRVLSLGVMQSAFALFYSGIFWMMVWFLIENRAAPSGERRPLVPLAVLLMVVSVYLMFDVVAHSPLPVS